MMEWFAETDLFVSGEGGYHTYRIPSLVFARDGTLLAFCEGRRDSRSDYGKIDILLRRSRDNGESWGEPQVVVADGEMTCGNPCPVLCREDGAIWLPFCKNPGEASMASIIAGEHRRTVWITASRDGGETWDEPQEISEQVKRPGWTWYATGPGHGIQLESGRLLVPCDHREGEASHSHVLYSDDSGQTWEIGGTAAEGTDECEAVQAVDGSIYLNCRNARREHRRLVAWSEDGGESFSPIAPDEALVEPICQASVARLSQAAEGGRNRILFSNPASTQRERMTVRLSYDECRTWPVSRLLHRGPAAYSDLAVAADGTIFCLYERGDSGPYEHLALARFNLEWLTWGEDRL